MRGTVAARIGPVSYEIDVGDALWSRHVDQLMSVEAAEVADSGPAGDTVARDGTAVTWPETSVARNGSLPVARNQREATRGSDGGSPTSDSVELEGPRDGDSRPTGVDGTRGSGDGSPTSGQCPVVPATLFRGRRSTDQQHPY